MGGAWDSSWMILTSTLVTKLCEASSPTGEALTWGWFSVSALPQVMLHQHHFPVAWSTLTTTCPLSHEAAVIRLGHDILGLSLCIFILTYLMTIQFWIFFFFYRNGILPHTASCGLPVFYLIIRLGIFPWLDLLLTHILFIASWWSKLDTLCFICLPRCMSMQITPREVLLL